MKKSKNLVFHSQSNLFSGKLQLAKITRLSTSIYRSDSEPLPFRDLLLEAAISHNQNPNSYNSQYRSGLCSHTHGYCWQNQGAQLVLLDSSLAQVYLLRTPLPRDGVRVSRSATELGAAADHILEMSFILQHILTRLFRKILPNQNVSESHGEGNYI